MEFHGLNLNEYLLIIEPETEIKQQIQQLKQLFTQRYRFNNAIVSKTHLTLMRCLQYESYEGLITQKLQNIAASTTPFSIHLQGFGNFGHTLYVNVKTAVPIVEIVANRRKELRPFVYNQLKTSPFFVTKPHITIARRLTPAQCSMVWAGWSRIPFEGHFRARNMLLLKRRVGTHRYRKVEKFTFSGRVPRTIQGRLFN